jgi:hypothetical protein
VTRACSAFVIALHSWLKALREELNMSPVYWDFTRVEAHAFSGIAGGLSARPGARKRPTIGLPVSGSIPSRATSPRASLYEAASPGVAAWGTVAGWACQLPWARAELRQKSQHSC